MSCKRYAGNCAVRYRPVETRQYECAVIGIMRSLIKPSFSERITNKNLSELSVNQIMGEVPASLINDIILTRDCVCKYKLVIEL